MNLLRISRTSSLEPFGSASKMSGIWASPLAGLVILIGVLSFSLQLAAQSEQPATAPPTTAQPAPAKPDTPASVNSHPSSPQPRARRVYRPPTIDERIKTFAKTLNLNATQQQGVKAVLERQQLQARQIQLDPTLSGEQRIGKFRALQEDTILRIRALLNDEQKMKYDPLPSHQVQDAPSSDSYVNQWMKYHERSEQPSQPPKK